MRKAVETEQVDYLLKNFQDVGFEDLIERVGK